MRSMISNFVVNKETQQIWDSKTLEERLKESRSISAKYPDRIPVICNRGPHSKIMPITKTKYLVPKELTPTQFLFIIRKRLSLDSKDGLFLFVNGSLPSSNTCFSDLYEQNKSEDGFLYVTYSEESVFG